VVAAPIVGALKTSHIDDAIAALTITLTDDEAARLEAPNTPRRDIQGISDPAVLARMAAQVGIKTAA
jgi:diketogulonate reductase-like aldo/keto reductase